jgi:ribosome-binding factor A
VRRLNSADAPRMCSIVAMLPPPEWRGENIPRFAHFARALADPAVYVFAAFEGERPAGLRVRLSLSVADRGMHLVYIYDVYVAPADQASGVGRRLVERVIAERRRDGATEAWVGTDLDNQAAQLHVSRRHGTWPGICPVRVRFGSCGRGGESMTRAKLASARAPSQRQLKVGELIRHALSEIFTRGEIVDDVLSRYSLTVPEVRMTPDLKLATVYVFPLGGEGASEAVVHLDKHKRFLRGELTKRVSMKFVPELRFKIDTSFETSRRIDELLASPTVARDLDLDD